MTSFNRAPRRPMLVVAAVSLALGLAACGGSGGDDGEGGSDGAVQDTEMTFTGDPVKVMVMAPIGTEVLNTPAMFDIAAGAVVDINNSGGINGHELVLVTCNDGFDPNIAAKCARDAVSEGVAAVVGGFSLFAPNILPVLETADIPWVGPPLISEAELSDPAAYPVNSGVMSMAALGRRAVEDGCENIKSVASETGNAGSDTLASLVDTGIESADGTKSETIRVPQVVSDFSGAAQQLEGADCVVISAPPATVTGVVAASASIGLDVDYYIFGGALTSEVIRPLGSALDGAVTTSNFPVANDPLWDEAKKFAGDLADDNNGGWTSVYAQNTWVAFQVFRAAVADLESFSGSDVTAALDANDEVETGGLTPPLSFTEEFDVTDLNRVFNRQVRFLTVENGEITPETEYFDLSPALGSAG